MEGEGCTVLKQESEEQQQPEQEARFPQPDSSSNTIITSDPSADRSRLADGGGGTHYLWKLVEEEQLSSSVKELSQGQIAINDQLQHDELLALEAIYGDNISVLDRHKGLRSFQIHVHLDLPKDFNLSVYLDSFSGDVENGGKLEPDADGNSAEVVYNFKVQNLPPIIFTCVLPQSYPSNCPPYFTINIEWLDETRISSLCRMLDTIWAEQSGQEVLYQWIEWLHSSSLSYLGFDAGIILAPSGISTSADRRSVSRKISWDSYIPILMAYDEEKCRENFLSNLYSCLICFNEYPGTDFMKLPCKHFFCSRCMQTYCNIHVKGGNVGKLRCPDSKCGTDIPPGLLKRLLSEEDFERWESLLLQKKLDAMSDVFYCPRCGIACLEDDANHAQCSKCFYSFCTLCRERRHVGNTCKTAEEKLPILQETAGNFSGRKKKVELEELLSLREIRHDAKQCPTCKTAISRTEGCNKMVCPNCGQRFCYRCGKGITGYDHFSNNNCVLFDVEEILKWEWEMNQLQIEGGQIQEAPLLHPNQWRVCPQCHEINRKVDNNNYMLCYICKFHFCALCGTTVRYRMQHYGRRGSCKQFTE